MQISCKYAKFELFTGVTKVTSLLLTTLLGFLFLKLDTAQGLIVLV